MDINNKILKLSYLLLQEQLDFYLIYIRKVDYCIFDKFEYCNKYYIKHLKNGNKILFDWNKNIYIDKENCDLLSFYDHKNTEFPYYHILYGYITVIYELKNNYSIRYDYYTHPKRRATFCEIEENLRICNYNNKTIYNFNDKFMNNLVKIFHRDLDKEFVYEIIDFYEKSILKNNEEYTKVGFNQLKKKENEMTKVLQDIIDKTEDWHDKGSWGMEKHILNTKRPAMYKEILKLNPNINLVYKDINNTSELNEFKKIFFKNLTNNFKNIKNVNIEYYTKKKRKLSVGQDSKKLKADIKRFITEEQKILKDFENSKNYTVQKALDELEKLSEDK